MMVPGTLTVIAAFLVTFLTPSLEETDQNQLLNKIHEDHSTNINIRGSIVLIHDTNPWSEWDAILNYNRGYLAAKLFSKKACVLTKMDKILFPSLEVLHKALDKQIIIGKISSKFFCRVTSIMFDFVTPFGVFLAMITGVVCHFLEANGLSRNYGSSQGLTYIILPPRIKNVAQYGKTITDLCRGVPTYFAHQHIEGTALALNPESCFKARIFANTYSFGISICGEIPGL